MLQCMPAANACCNCGLLTVARSRRAAHMRSSAISLFPLQTPGWFVGGRQAPGNEPPRRLAHGRQSRRKLGAFLKLAPTRMTLAGNFPIL